MGVEGTAPSVPQQEATARFPPAAAALFLNRFNLCPVFASYFKIACPRRLSRSRAETLLHGGQPFRVVECGSAVRCAVHDYELHRDPGLLRRRRTVRAIG